MRGDMSKIHTLKSPPHQKISNYGGGGVRGSGVCENDPSMICVRTNLPK